MRWNPSPVVSIPCRSRRRLPHPWAQDFVGWARGHTRRAARAQLPMSVTESWILAEHRVPVQLIPRDRHEVHLVVPGPALDAVRLVAVIRPRTPIRGAGPVGEDVDPERVLVEHLRRDHPAPRVEEALLLERHLDASF